MNYVDDALNEFDFAVEREMINELNAIDDYDAFEELDNDNFGGTDIQLNRRLSFSDDRQPHV